MNQMCVKNKDNNETYEVYDITYDNKGYPHFLIYKDNQWLRMSAKHFRPLNAKDFNALIEKWSSCSYLEAD
jgi:hypothetical protein